MSTRPLMNVNEDSEILSKLGILSTKQSPNKAHKQTSSSTPRKEKNDFVEVKVDDWKWEADTFAAQSDDEQSDENLVYDKHTLLDDRSSNRSLRRRSSGVTCRNILLASSFLSLGLSLSVVGPTLPDIGTATLPGIGSDNSTNMISLSYVIVFSAIGQLFGTVILSWLFTRISPMVFLLFCTLGVVPFTVLIAWSTSLSICARNICVLGIFLGAIHRGVLIIMYGKGGGVRTLFALHACLALGGCIAPLMSAPFVFNSVRTGTLPTNPLMSIDINGHHAVNKRHITGIEALNATGIDDQMTNSSELIASAVESPKRPDHAIGQVSEVEPKSKENQLKRKEVEARKKQQKEAANDERTINENCNSSTANSSDCANAEQNRRHDESSSSKSVSSTPPMGNGSDSLSNKNANKDEIQHSTEPSVKLSTSRPSPASTTRMSPSSTTTTILPTTTTTIKSITTKTPSHHESPIKSGVSAEKNPSSKIFGKIVTNGQQTDSSTIHYGYLDESDMWKIVKKQVLELNDVKLIYSLVGVLCLCCTIPFVISFICCCEPLSMVPDLRIAKLRSDPETNNTDRTDQDAVYCWRFMARLFFILVGGVEMSLGSLVTLYILGIFPKQPSQLNGALVTSTFWAGVLITRLVCTFSIRIATSPRVMQMLLLAASALCGYAALFPSTTLHAICLQLFLIGILTSSLQPGLLCWLDSQLAISRLSSTLLYASSVSIGHGLIPYLSVIFMSNYSSVSNLLLTCAVCLSFAFILHMLLVRSVRKLARFNAINEFSDTVMTNEEDDEDEAERDSNKNQQTKRETTRNGGANYVALISSDLEMDTLVDIGEEADPDDDL